MSQRARRITKDYEKSFKGGRPRFCPVREDYNHINPAGNRCDKAIAETIHNGAGEVIAWRCARGHIFQRLAESDK